MEWGSIKSQEFSAYLQIPATKKNFQIKKKVLHGIKQQDILMAKSINSACKKFVCDYLQHAALSPIKFCNSSWFKCSDMLKLLACIQCGSGKLKIYIFYFHRWMEMNYEWIQFEVENCKYLNFNCWSSIILCAKFLCLQRVRVLREFSINV